MNNNKFTAILCFILSAIIFSCCNKTIDANSIEYVDKIKLGKLIFLDKNLSNPIGQSCSSCHSSSSGFSDLEHNIVSPGIVSGLFGNRNAPMAMYTKYNPVFYYDNEDSSYVGGLFLDGRVNTLEEQAQKPFMNPLEMNNSSVGMLMQKIRSANYYGLFTKVYGNTSDDNIAFNNLVDAIANYERSPELNPFTSKFDYYLKGLASLTAQEKRGLILFNDTTRAKCGNCHLTTPEDNSGMVLFTDFTYNNDGVPKNTYNPFYNIPSSFNPMGSNYIDYGLGAIIKDHSHDGEFRVPSLRNVAITAPYFHNGAFGTLEEVVHFYNTRDVAGSGFGKPEVASTVNTTETGNLKLTAQEEADIVAFLKTLTDGFK